MCDVSFWFFSPHVQEIFEILRTAVESNSGVVTHHLHIIDAVGARISRAGLDEALKSPLVSRYIDNLKHADDPAVEPGTPGEQCDIGGALELELDATGFRWRLYNKKQQAAKKKQKVTQKF